MTVLSTHNLSKSFGGVRAVDDVSIEVREGCVTGLIGPNGAGKTTLFDLVTGFQRPDAGTVHLRGERIDRLPPHHVSRLGLVRTFQLVRLLPALTAVDNLVVSARTHPGESIAGSLFGGWRATEAAERERALRWLRSVGMAHRADVRARDLSYGQSKLVELARALLLDADVILLDEPMSGINPSLRQALLATLQRLRRDEGKTFLVIEHDIEMIMAECDDIIVMDAGRVIAHGPPEEVRDDPRVIEAYLGTGRKVRLSEAYPATSRRGDVAAPGVGTSGNENRNENGNENRNENGNENRNENRNEKEADRA